MVIEPSNNYGTPEALIVIIFQLFYQHNISIILDFSTFQSYSLQNTQLSSILTIQQN